MKRGFVAGATFLLAIPAFLGCTGPAPTPPAAATQSGPVASVTPRPPLAASGTAESSSPSVAAPSDDASSTTIRVYFVRDEKVSPVARAAVGPAVANAAIEALLAGPSADERAAGLTTALPVGTSLRSVVIEAGTATVDLSAAYSGGGGSLSMMSRIAQLVFTVTQFPTVERVSISIDGVPATAIGGEGIIVDRPQTRADWESFAPPILVESPLPGESVVSPFHATGSSNTFEARYGYRLRGADGSVLVKGRGSATSGTGTRGTFDQTISYAATSAGGTGTLELFELSARDGSEINLVRIPLTLR